MTFPKPPRTAAVVGKYDCRVCGANLSPDTHRVINFDGSQQHRKDECVPYLMAAVAALRAQLADRSHEARDAEIARLRSTVVAAHTISGCHCVACTETRAIRKEVSEVAASTTSPTEPQG